MKGRLLDAVPLSSLTGVGAALSNKLANYPHVNQQGEIEADADWWSTMQAAG